MIGGSEHVSVRDDGQVFKCVHFNQFKPKKRCFPGRRGGEQIEGHSMTEKEADRRTSRRPPPIYLFNDLVPKKWQRGGGYQLYLFLTLPNAELTYSLALSLDSSVSRRAVGGRAKMKINCVSFSFFRLVSRSFVGRAER